MRSIVTLALVLAASLGAASMGCGKGGSSGSAGSAGKGGTGGTATTGGAATGGTATTGTMTGTGGSMTTSGTGGMDCSNALMNPNDCGKCVEMSCCAQLLACQADNDCNTCLTSAMPPDTCNMNMLLKGVTDCQMANCQDTCNPASPGKCAQYCCADGDCGTGKCDKTLIMGVTTVGLCVDAMKAPACDAPAMPASMGSCFTKDANNVCNPVTNDGCKGDQGEACDLDGSSGNFVCFPAPNDQAICTMCDNANGPFCKGGMHCVGGM